MKNAKRIAEMSKNIINSDKSTWIPLFYSFKENDVFTKPSLFKNKERFELTQLTNPVTESELEKIVDRFINM